MKIFIVAALLITNTAHAQQHWIDPRLSEHRQSYQHDFTDKSPVWDQNRQELLCPFPPGIWLPCEQQRR